MFNRVILMGRLTKDPELKTTQTGVNMCRFSIAVERKYSGKNAEKQTDFFDITAWRQTADFVCKYFSKGNMILVEGSLQNNNYTDNNGVKHYSTVIIAENVSFTGEKTNNQNNGYQQAIPQQNYQQGGQQSQVYTNQYQQGNTPQQPTINPQFAQLLMTSPLAQPIIPQQPIQTLADLGEPIDGDVPF